ncbi:hypothetical protein SDC9_105954 [bioreactor metagenome]|uniref:Uncharacterized protein n=1 Tax=bioreactor metagenome TaxID=1076179 RepID=A0A645B226_9ZZZZ
MLYSGDFNGGNRRSGQRGQQDAAQGVAQRSAIAALQGLNHIFPVRAVARLLYTFDAGFFDFYHVLPSFLRRRVYRLV